MNETGFPEQIDKSQTLENLCENFSIKLYLNMYMKPHAPIFYIFLYFDHIIINKLFYYTAPTLLCTQH